jgi:hypothetical protein
MEIGHDRLTGIAIGYQNVPRPASAASPLSARACVPTRRPATARAAAARRPASARAASSPRDSSPRAAVAFTRARLQELAAEVQHFEADRFDVHNWQSEQWSKTLNYARHRPQATCPRPWCEMTKAWTAPLARAPLAPLPGSTFDRSVGSSAMRPAAEPQQPHRSPRVPARTVDRASTAADVTRRLAAKHLDPPPAEAPPTPTQSCRRMNAPYNTEPEVVGCGHARTDGAAPSIVGTQMPLYVTQRSPPLRRRGRRGGGVSVRMANC